MTLAANPVIPLKRLAAVMPSNVDKHSVDGEQQVSLCNYVDVYKNERITDALNFMEATATEAQVSRFTLQAHDVIVTKDSEEPTDIGIPAYVPSSLPGVVCGYHLAVLRPSDERLYGGYLHWALQSAEVKAYYSTAATGISRYALGIGDLGMTPIHVPSRTEQVRIANFLDEQTARIDALIAEKERLMVLLSEQRLSIAERVMADSASGTKAKLGFHADFLAGYAFPSDEFSRDESDIPLLRGVNVAPASIRWDDVVYWRRDYDTSLERFRLQAGDVVFGMDRPWISSGARVAMIDADSAGAFLLQRVCRLRGGSKMRQRFLFYALSSDAFRQSIEVDLTGVSVPHISPEQVLGFKVPVLTPEEQDVRCAEADRQTEALQGLATHTDGLLNRLREYRSSLISAAVTGQLDLSTFKAAE